MCRNDQKPVPAYRRHKQSGQAIVTLVDGVGTRRDVLLGKFGTAGSRQEYARVIAEWETSGRQVLTPATAADITIAELIDRYWLHVKTYYRRADGIETQEVKGFLYALRPLNHLYGNTPAKSFGPIALKAVRDLMVHGYDHPRYGKQGALSRGVINQRVKRIRRMFRWAVEQEILPAMVLQALESVPGLKRGRTVAYDTNPVGPVSRAVVEDTLPLLRPMQADMVRLQLATGMRPGELVIMRDLDIDMSGEIWLYKLGQHKTSHHGHQRLIAIGPVGQEIIRHYLTTDIQAYLFSPARNMAERSIALRMSRKSHVQPSQQNRRKRKARKKPGIVYTVTTYRRAIAEAIRRHNEGKPEGEHIPHWHPHQLRHLRALELKREFGLDVARAVLGHRSPVLTDHYAGLDVGAAADAMARMG